MRKTLDSTNFSTAKVNTPDLRVYGDDLWVLLCKASSEKEGWMKSTKAMEIRTEGSQYTSVRGCLVQVTTQQGDYVAEALTYIPDVRISRNEDREGAKLISV